MFCISLNLDNNVGVQVILSFPDLLEGIWSSRGLVRAARRESGRQISWNLSPPNQLLRLLTVDGGGTVESGSILCLLGLILPSCQWRPSISAV